MGFSFLTHGIERRYSSCNPCLPCPYRGGLYLDGCGPASDQ